MHTISKPYLEGTQHKRDITVTFKIPSGATPIQATLDYKYLKFGCVEYWFDKEIQKSGSGRWLYDDEYQGYFCSSCEYSPGKVTQYCPECGKYMSNYMDEGWQE